MDQLVANLIEAYRRSITDLDWMTEETKESALTKLAKFPITHRLPDQVAGLFLVDDQPRMT
jgi:predicted metalloendopeptidase